MARLIISSLLVASFVLSGAFAGLLPGILPGIIPNIPSTKDVAKAQINRGAGIGKGRINGDITWWTATVNSDPELTPECKACCAAAANEIRANVIAEIDTVASTLVQKIDNTLTVLLGALLIEIWGELLSTNGIIANIVSDLDISLDNAKQTCKLQTANTSTTTVVA